MSFITKRERVFNEYDLFDLPARNEGKLKAYASCTDARAWSHFYSDKTEHLVEIIKRNNEVCRTKYVPTDVIVDTIMIAKNAEITRLKRKIEEFEQMIAAYDQLDLTCEQKCEIANAHSAIKSANKELDELCLNLDLSGFTEGVDSEGFQTGKSSGDENGKFRGDEIIERRPVMETKCNQSELTCTCEVSTSAHDSRIDDMQEAIISKDAKLSAMQNTIASSGKDTRCIDIKGRILFKLKVLEKFSLALIAPCSQESEKSSQSDENCACYHAEIITHVETTFALTSSETVKPCMDNKRSQLVADIMENDEMKEIMGKESISAKLDNDQIDDMFCVEDYSIDAENLNRLKSLQVNYDELMTCYENMKHERDCLKIRCEKYEELEKEYLALQTNMREYNTLWNEKEHFRKRSEDLDSLKEQYLILTEETTNLETQLKAEAEINSIKSNTVDDLRTENILLEKKLNDASIANEKEKNALHCKLKETECQVMCQEQQIKSLSAQIDRLLEHDHHKKEDVVQSIQLIDEMESLRDQIKNLQDALFCSEEEKQQLQEQFQEKLNNINDLRMEIEDWKSTYEKTFHRNDCLEKCTENFRDEVHRLMEENRNLSRDVEEKTTAVGNLINIVNNKSHEINGLIEQIEQKRRENRDLLKQLRGMRESYNSDVVALETEKKQAFDSLHLARQESQELLEKVKDYDDIVHKKDDMTRYLQTQNAEYNELKEVLKSTIEEKKKLQLDLESQENHNAILLLEIKRLREVNNYAVDNINNLQDEKNEYKSSLEITKKESAILESKLSQFEDVREQLNKLKTEHQKLVEGKNKLENQLQSKSSELDNAISSLQITKKESEELILEIENSNNLKKDFLKLNGAYQALANEKQNLLESLNNLTRENKELLNKCKLVATLEQELVDSKKMYKELMSDFHNKTEEIDNLYNTLEDKIEENRELFQKMKMMQQNEQTADHNIAILQDEHLNTQTALEAVKKESEALMNKLKQYESLVNEFEKLKHVHGQMKLENEQLQKELNNQMKEMKKIQKENIELNDQSRNLMVHNEDLENSLINARNELLSGPPQQNPYKDIMKEIEDLRKEKLNNQKKIKDLRVRLDETENIISNLSEDLLQRNDKISILENHINSLEDEVRQLHNNLDKVVDTGEQMKDSYHKIDQSLYKMEAHHSKATHNMKMELAKLQNDNAKLEQQLSLTKLKSDESFRERHKYMSQIIHIQNEREIIVTNIKQLELTAIGDSGLAPGSCSTEDILYSIDRITKSLNAKTSKSTTLEQTLLKVQTSSQLLLTKADEAKKIVEKEKQKIINEKEEAVTARLNMEKQLAGLKEKLEKQTNHDKGVIKDLESEILNQKLIIDKINNSTQNYISKLQDEMKNLQELYQKSISKVKELEDKIGNLSDENIKNVDVIERIKKHLSEKSEEVAALQKNMDELKNKEMKSFGTQARLTDDHKHVTSQTDKDPQISGYVNTIHNMEPCFKENNIEDIEDNINVLKVNKPSHDKHIAQLLPQQTPQSVNEVQILTANVEPTFDFVKNSYLNYKIKRLSTGRMEQYSITCLDGNVDSNIASNLISESFEELSGKTLDSKLQNPRLVDIYNRQSLQTNSSKVDHVDMENTASVSRDPQSATKSSAYTGFGLTNDIFESHSNVNSNKYNDSNAFIGSSSGKSTDKDLFVIYRDSENSGINKGFDEKELWQVTDQPQILTGALSLGQNKNVKKTDKKSPKGNIQKKFLIEDELFHEAEDQFIKPKLTIELPRVELGSTSGTTSDLQKESIRSPHDREKNVKQSDVPEVRSQSHHKLSRVDANFLLIKNKNNLNQSNKQDPGKIKEPGNFGLEYILDSVQREVNPDMVNTLRPTRSDERFTQLSHNGASDSSQLKSSAEFKTLSSMSPHSDKSPPKSVVEQSVLAKIDTTESYEKKILYLTKTLENIEKDYKKKIEAIKAQYDANIKSIINEHNQGVKSIQSLHEETLQDILKIHENEVENLRSMSIEAMRKAEKFERENKLLKSKIQEKCTCLDEEPVKISTSEHKKPRSKCRGDTKMLTKTNVEAFNVKPKLRSHGPCTCSLDINISDTIRNIFEQVDVEQRKMAECTYLKYIANKILSGNFENLDAQELSFLHLKVCKTWKFKLTKEEALQKRIDTLETELMNKQRHAQQHIAELDRKVAEERRRLQEVREAVCRSTTPTESQVESHDVDCRSSASMVPIPPMSPPIPDMEFGCVCKTGAGCTDLNERRSAGDLMSGISGSCPRTKRAKPESSRGVLSKLDIEERREKKFYNDEPPTRLRRAHDRPSIRPHKK